MMNQGVKSVVMSMPITEADIPDGDYDGTMSGYMLEFTHDGKTYTIETTVGIRGKNIRKRVKVRHGKVIFQ